MHSSESGRSWASQTGYKRVGVRTNRYGQPRLPKCTAGILVLRIFAIARFVIVQQIWTPSPCPLVALLVAPGLDAAVVSRQQDLRDCPLTKHGRARVVRLFEEPVAEGFGLHRLRIAENTWK